MEGFFSSKNSFLYILGILFFLLIFNSLFFNAPRYFPIGDIVNIQEGSSLHRISKYLKDEKIIGSRMAFEAFVIMFGGEKHIVLGDYLFEKKMPVFDIASRLTHGYHNLAPVKVTIPEGSNNKEIADIFGTKLLKFNKIKFLTEIKDKEGYLFPDTYFFSTTDTEKEVIKVMKDNFNKKVPLVFSTINISDVKKKDIIIMASIIEREAEGDNDRAIISGILWKRFKKGMLLQVDAVPETYKTKGLPKNPISNPGLEAIEASIHPKVSSYFFYLHDKAGVAHYAVTFNEHVSNKLKYLK